MVKGKLRSCGVHTAFGLEAKESEVCKKKMEMAFQEGENTRQPGVSSVKRPLLIGPWVTATRDGLSR